MRQVSNWFPCWAMLRFNSVFLWESAIFFALFHVCAFHKLNDDDEARKKFNYFKKKYDKKYETWSQELDAYTHFIENWNLVDEKNEKGQDENALFTLNRYADLKASDMAEHFGLKLTPYATDIVDNPEERFFRSAQLRTGNAEPKTKPPKTLYDIAHAEDLYDNFLQKYHKKKLKDEDLQYQKYLRFVKNLVILNKRRWDGESVEYDEYADELLRPDKYLF